MTQPDHRPRGAASRSAACSCTRWFARAVGRAPCPQPIPVHEAASLALWRPHAGRDSGVMTRPAIRRLGWARRALFDMRFPEAIASTPCMAPDHRRPDAAGRRSTGPARRRGPGGHWPPASDWARRTRMLEGKASSSIATSTFSTAARPSSPRPIRIRTVRESAYDGARGRRGRKAEDDSGHRQAPRFCRLWCDRQTVPSKASSSMPSARLLGVKAGARWASPADMTLREINFDALSGRATITPD